MRVELNLVLIVEDDPMSRRALKHLLTLHGMNVQAAASAEEASLMLRKDAPPKIALVDINLPGMNGVDFVHELHRICPATMCIFMTANEEAVDQSIRSGSIDALLRKPLDVSSLMRLMAPVAKFVAKAG